MKRLLHKAILMFLILSFNNGSSTFIIPLTDIMETIKWEQRSPQVECMKKELPESKHSEKKPRGRFKEVKRTAEWHKPCKGTLLGHDIRKLFKMSTCHSCLLSCLLREQKDNTKERKTLFLSQCLNSTNPKSIQYLDTRVDVWLCNREAD